MRILSIDPHPWPGEGRLRNIAKFDIELTDSIRGRERRSFRFPPSSAGGGLAPLSANRRCRGACES